jgi:predicted dehydrogenase
MARTSEDTKELRVGIIGAGGNTRKFHIPLLQAITGVSVVAVANRSLDSAAKVTKEFGISKASDNWAELISDATIDAIVVGTWPYLHKTLTIAALKAGKHVLTEARLAMNASEAWEMLRVSQAHPNLVTQVVPSPITFEWDATIADIIKAGTLGDLVYIEVKGVAGSFAQPQGSPLTWRTDISKSGFNVMMMGIYYESLQRWIGDVTSVQALGKTVVSLRKDGDKGDLKAVHIPDHLDILAQHPSGAHVHFLFSSVLGAVQGLKSGFVIYGTNGTLQLDLDTKKLTLGLKSAGPDGDSLVKEVHVADERKGKWRVEEEFVNAIRGEETVTRTDFTTGVAYMEFTEAVTRSLQSGQTVKLLLVP